MEKVDYNKVVAQLIYSFMSNSLNRLGINIKDLTMDDIKVWEGKHESVFIHINRKVV
jgi:hypothetical protein